MRSDGYGRRNRSQKNMSPSATCPELSVYLSDYAPFISMAFIMSPGGGGWGEGTKLLIAKFLPKMSRLFCVNEGVRDFSHNS